MRPFEIILLIILLLLTSYLLVQRRIPAGFVIGLCLSAGVVWLVHLTLEGTRWQMWLAYLMLAHMVGSSSWATLHQFKFPKRWQVALLTPAVLLALALPIILPVPDIPTPSGPYPIGTVSYQWDDPTRPEIYTAAPDDIRQIMVQIWYPAAPQPNSPPAPYLTDLDIVGPILADRLGFPSFLFNHVNLIQTHSTADAPLAVTPNQFPVLIYSPGYNSLRTQHTSLMEELASYGYIVVALDHTYVGVVTIFPNGRVEFLNPDILPGRSVVGEEKFRQNAIALGDVWVQDIRFVLNRLQAEAIDEKFIGRMNLNNMGFFGHSTGAGVISRVCATEPECQAGIGLDAWLEPAPEVVLNSGSPRPLAFLMSERWPSELNKGLMAQYLSHTTTGYWLTIQGTDHYDFTDLPLLTPLNEMVGLGGSVDSYRMQAINRAYVRTFFDQHLKGESNPLWSGDIQNYPEIIWEKLP